jgi:hypothetical protein
LTETRRWRRAACELWSRAYLAAESVHAERQAAVIPQGIVWPEQATRYRVQRDARIVKQLRVDDHEVVIGLEDQPHSTRLFYMCLPIH